jgi:translation initiation factor IF-2
MSDENENKPTLTRKPLGLTRSVQSGEVKQTFSHGRTNKVVVEVKRRKLVGKPGYEAEPEVVAAPPPPPVAAAPAPVAAPLTKAPANDIMSRQERQAKLLRDAEVARLDIQEDNRRREDEQRAKTAETERNRAAENREAEKTVAAVVTEPAAVVAETSEVSDEAAAPAAASPPAARRFTPVEAPKRPEREEVKKAPQRPGVKDRNDRRQSGKLTVTRALDDNEGARARSLAALKRAREKEKRLHGGGGRREAQPKQSRDVIVPER